MTVKNNKIYGNRQFKICDGDRDSTSTDKYPSDDDLNEMGLTAILGRDEAKKLMADILSMK